MLEDRLAVCASGASERTRELGLYCVMDDMRGIVCFFFFQAEDGIRDYMLTGVHTCALPIYRLRLLGGPDRLRQDRRQMLDLQEGGRRSLRAASAEPADSRRHFPWTSPP